MQWLNGAARSLCHRRDEYSNAAYLHLDTTADRLSSALSVPVFLGVIGHPPIRFQIIVFALS